MRLIVLFHFLIILKSLSTSFCEEKSPMPRTREAASFYYCRLMAFRSGKYLTLVFRYWGIAKMNLPPINKPTSAIIGHTHLASRLCMTGGSCFGSPTKTNRRQWNNGPRQAGNETWEASSTIHTSKVRRTNKTWLTPRHVVATTFWNGQVRTPQLQLQQSRISDYRDLNWLQSDNHRSHTQS